MSFPSDAICSACGAVLPEGRQFTCNDRCEAAYNGKINEYISAAKLHRHSFEGQEPASTNLLAPTSPWFGLAARLARDAATRGDK